jgi:hypothetical protein
LPGHAQSPPVEVGFHSLGTVFIACRQVGISLGFQLEDFFQGAEGAFHSRGCERFLAPQRSEKDLAVVHALEHLVVASQGVGGLQKGTQHTGGIKGLRRKGSVVVINGLGQIDAHIALEMGS